MDPANSRNAPFRNDEMQDRTKMFNEICAVIERSIRGITEFAKPTASVTNVRIDCINDCMAYIYVDVLVEPNSPLPLELNGGHYAFSSQGRFISRGTIDMEVLVINSSGCISLPLEMNFSNMDESIKPGSIVPYEIGIGITGKALLLGNISLSIDVSNDNMVPVPNKLNVVIEKIYFCIHSESSDKICIVLSVKWKNNNDFNMLVQELNCRISFSGIGNGSCIFKNPITVDKNQMVCVEVPASFSTSVSVSQLLNLDGHKEDVSYTLKGFIEANTTFGKMKLHFASEGNASTVKQHNGDKCSGLNKMAGLSLDK